jgi:hypothetical protein
MTTSLTRSPRPVTPRPLPGPDPERFARLLVQVWFEVCSGRRPFAQLAPLVTPALRRRLLARLPKVPHARKVPPCVTIRRVVVTSPSDSAYEMCVLIEHAERVTAVALRIERHHAVWRAVEMTAPEAGLDPLATAPGARWRRPRDAFDEVLEGP